MYSSASGPGGKGPQYPRYPFDHISPADMELFCRVVEGESMSKLSRESGEAFSSIRRRIRKIEKICKDQPLFENNEHVMPTHEGRMAAWYFRIFLREISSDRESLSRIDLTRSLPDVTCTVADSIAQSLLTSSLDGFHEAAGDPWLYIHRVSSAEDFYGSELSFHAGEFDPVPGFEEIPVCSLKFSCVYRPSGKRDYPESVFSLQELPSESTFLFLKSFFGNASLRPGSCFIKNSCSYDDITGLRAALKAGNGIAVVPRFLVDDLIHKPCETITLASRPDITVYAVCRKEMRNSPYNRTIIERVRDHCSIRLKAMSTCPDVTAC